MDNDNTQDAAQPSPASAGSRPLPKVSPDRLLEILRMNCESGDILCGDAADEIISLRAMLTRQSESAHRAVALMGKYAERYGFLLGGLEMVATGHTTAERVLQSAREKYPDED